MTTKNFKVKNGIDIGDDYSINAATGAAVLGNVELDQVELVPAAGSNTTKLRATPLSDDQTYSFPAAYPVADKQILSADTSSGVLYWNTLTTTDVAEGTNLYYTDARVDARIAASSIDDLSDVVITAASNGDLLYWDGADWVNSKTVTGAGAYTFERATGGTGSNAMFSVKRTRTGGGPSNFQGPWLVGEYSADGFTGGPVGSVNFLYQSTGGGASQTDGNLIRLTSHPLTAGTQNRIADMKRGNFTLYNNSVGNNTLMNVSDADLTYKGLDVSAFNFTYSGLGLNEFTTSNTTALGPVLALTHARTDVTGPQDGDRVDFRLNLAGTATNMYVAKFEGQYSSAGDHEITLNVFDSGGTITQDVVRGQMTQVKLRSADNNTGANTIDVATFSKPEVELNTQLVTINDNAGVPLCGSSIVYSRQYLEATNNTSVTPAAADTIYKWTYDTTEIANGISIVSGSQITFTNPGQYDLQFSAQWDNADNTTEHDFFIWLQENGADVPRTAGRVTCPKAPSASISSAGITQWNYLLDVVTANDYVELAYAVSNTNITFPQTAAITSPYARPSIPSLIVTVTPVGA